MLLIASIAEGAHKFSNQRLSKFPFLNEYSVILTTPFYDMNQKI